MTDTILLTSQSVSCEPAFRPHHPSRTRTRDRTLWCELLDQRAALVREIGRNGLQASAPELLSDVIDQATADQDRELRVQANARLYDKVRQIDFALLRMERRTYGLCIRCEQEIPIARLKVQPAALTCIACQKQAETRYRDAPICAHFAEKEPHEQK